MEKTKSHMARVLYEALTKACARVSTHIDSINMVLADQPPVFTRDRKRR